METKNRLKITLLAIFVISIMLNIFLIRNKVEINIIRGAKQAQISGDVSREVVQRKKSLKALGADFYNDFENGSSERWKGRAEKSNVPKGSRYALEAPKGQNRYFSAATYKNFIKPLVVEKNTVIEFDYYINRGSVLRVQFYCRNRQDNFYFDVKNPELNEWKTITLELANFQDNSHRGISPQKGDILTDVQIYGGKAGEDTTLLVDNFRIYEE